MPLLAASVLKAFVQRSARRSSLMSVQTDDRAQSADWIARCTCIRPARPPGAERTDPPSFRVDPAVSL